MSFMERVAPVVDETIRALAKTKFVPDPVARLKYSRATSIVSSAYKRHGRILENSSPRGRIQGFARGRCFGGISNGRRLSANDAALWRQRAYHPSGHGCLRQRRPDYSSVRGQARKWPIRCRQDSLDQTRFDVHPGSAQELRRRFSQAQPDCRRIQDHLLLRRSFDSATIVSGSRGTR